LLLSVTLAGSDFFESLTTVSNTSVVHRRAVNIYHSNFAFGMTALAETKYPGFRDIDVYRFGFSLFGYPTLVSAWDDSVARTISLNDSSVSDILNAYHAFGARFIALVEYEESNGIPGFQVNDTIQSTYSLKNANWNPISYTYVDVSNDSRVYVVTISTTDGVFLLRLFYAGHGAYVDHHLLSGDNIKFSLHINYYNYSGASSSNTSKIGLITIHACIDDKLNAIVDRDSSTAGLDHTNNATGVRGFYDWDKSINETSYSTQHSRTVITDFAFTYTSPAVYADWTGQIVVRVTLHTLGLESARPLNLVWDPSVGQDVSYSEIASIQSGNPQSGTTPSTASSAVSSKISAWLVVVIATLLVVL